MKPGEMIKEMASGTAPSGSDDRYPLIQLDEGHGFEGRLLSTKQAPTKLGPRTFMVFDELQMCSKGNAPVELEPDARMSFGIFATAVKRWYEESRPSIGDRVAIYFEGWAKSKAGNDFKLYHCNSSPPEVPF